MIKKSLIGLLAGIVSGLFSTGGGLILVPAFINILEKKAKISRATSVVCILPMVIVTSMYYYKNEYIDWKIGSLCAIGGVIGGIIGAKLLNIVSEKYMRIVFTIFLGYVAFNMIIS